MLTNADIAELTDSLIQIGALLFQRAMRDILG